MTVKTDIQWNIGDNVASELADDTPVLTRGTEISLRFLFRGGKIHDDGTMHDDGTFHGDLVAHYKRLRDRLKFTDASIRRGTSYNGVPWVRERLPERAPVDSQVVLVEPQSGVVDVDSFWAAVVGGGTDHRPSGENDARWLTLELFVLADGSEYQDRQALLDDLGSEVV